MRDACVLCMCMCCVCIVLLRVVAVVVHLRQSLLGLTWASVSLARYFTRSRVQPVWESGTGKGLGPGGAPEVAALGFGPILLLLLL